MKQDEIINDQELSQMESSLRSMTSAIDSDGPDDRYWANFRVRVMDQIEQKETAKQRSIFASVIEWFSASAMRGFAVGAAVLFVAIGSFAVLDSSNDIPQVAATQPVSQPASNPIVNKPADTKSVATVTTPVAPANTAATHKVVPTTPNTNLAAVAKPSGKEKIIAQASDFSNYDQTLSVGSTDDPIDYSTLSESELESVITTVTAMN